jgi:hypothetical protein
MYNRCAIWEPQPRNTEFQRNMGLAYDYTESSQFGAKTDRNLVFLVCDSHIAHQLNITVPYMNFYGF